MLPCTSTKIKTSQSLSIFSFGSFEGGQFCTDDGVIDIIRNPTLFTCDILHWVQDFVGDRCSVALYCHKRSQELSSDMAKVLTASGFVLPAALTPSEECPALRRDDLGDSRAVTLIEIGVHGLSAREFVSKQTKSAAFLHFNADVMKNVMATFPETAVFDLNSQMHAFAEWALAVSSSKWIISLTMVGIQEDDSIMTTYWKVRQLAENLHMECETIGLQLSADEVVSEFFQESCRTLPFSLPFHPVVHCSGSAWLWLSGTPSWPKKSKVAEGAGEFILDSEVPTLMMPWLNPRSRPNLLTGCSLVQRTYSYHDLFELELVKCSDGSCRKLKACEVETALGWRSDATNRIPKAQGESIDDRERRRFAMLACSLPARVVEFAFESVMPEMNKKTTPTAHPIPPSCLSDCLSLRESCEFINFIGLPHNIKDCVGPHEFELNANTPSMLVETLQSRRATGRHTLLSAVPAGLGPIEHFMEGLAAASPLDCEPQVPHDIEFCLQKIKELGGGIHQWR